MRALPRLLAFPLPICLLLAPIPAHATGRFALLIGAGMGTAYDRPLAHADDDVARLREALVLAGFPADRVQVLHEPDVAEVRARLRRLAETLGQVREAELVVVAFVGHADERGLHLAGGMLPVAELDDAVANLPSRARLALLDLCARGSIEDSGAPSTPALELTQPPSRAGSTTRVSVLGMDELTQRSRAPAGSLFVHHLVSGLRGAAGVSPGDTITVDGALRYALRRSVPEGDGDTLTRSLTELGTLGALPLAQLPPDTPFLVLPPGEGVRYLVVDVRETRLIAEATTNTAGEVKLALAPGSYRVLRIQGSRVEGADLALAGAERKRASELSWTARPPGAGLLPGRPAPEDAEAEHAWRRAEALSRLAAGNVRAAREKLDALAGKDPVVRRARARVLLRLAEGHAASGEADLERKALREALAEEPSLLDDPSFRPRYSKLLLAELDVERDREFERLRKEQLQTGPRRRGRWGIGWALFSPQGIVLDVVVNWYPGDHFSLHATIGLIGLDLGGRAYLFPGRSSPYLGAAYHHSLFTGSGFWDTGFHLDTGFQFVGSFGPERTSTGWCVELGGSLVFVSPQEFIPQGMSILPHVALGLIF